MTHTAESSGVRLRLPSSGTCLKSQSHLASSLFLNCFTLFLTGFFTNHLHSVHHLRTAFWGTQQRYPIVGCIHLKMWMKISTYCDQSQCITMPHLSLPPTISVRSANILTVTQAQSFGAIFNYFLFT